MLVVRNTGEKRSFLDLLPRDALEQVLARSYTRSELQERRVLLMVNEAARCLEEKVVATPDDVDFGMVMGTGFAPFRGGPLRHADSVGIAGIVAAMRRRAVQAPRFEPCPLLQNLAGRHERFHRDRTGSGSSPGIRSNNIIEPTNGP